MMQWDDLKFFLAVARVGSLADAARDLRSSPATVGRRISALETELGVRLFNRDQSGYSLTPNGQQILSRAEAVESSVLDVERSIVGRDKQPVGVVRLATAVEIAAILLTPHLSEFHRCYPGIVLDVTGELDVANLIRREADIGLRTVPPQEGDLIVRRAGWWKCGLYSAKSYAELHNLKRGLKDLANLDVITWSEEHSGRRAAQWFAEHAQSANVVLRANARRIHYTACKAGLGIAILPCVLADPDPDLVQLLPAEQVFTADLYIVVHRDLTTMARVRAVVDFFCERILKTTR
jgi:DNA-binding transcriptional LysR family regulator